MTFITKKFAVLLSGCGHLDGAEVSESVLAMLHMDKLDIEFDVFAFDKLQTEVIDHCTKKMQNENRNMMSEAARISRVIHDAFSLNPQKYDALIMPGGMGVAKNFSNLATAESEFEVMPEVAQLINEFVSLEKPIGGICISPAIIAKILKVNGYDPIITLGDFNSLLESLEIQQEPCNADEIVIDHENKIVTTPAYMLETRLSEMSRGIEKLISKVQELC